MPAGAAPRLRGCLKGLAWRVAQAVVVSTMGARNLAARLAMHPTRLRNNSADILTV